MKRSFCILLSFIFLCLLTACGNSADERSFEAMDTVMSLKVWGDDSVCETLEDRACALDGILSSTDPDSDIFRLNKSGSAALCDDALNLVSRSLALSAQLKGAFDPTIYPAVLEWGFIDGNYHVPDNESLAGLVSLIDSSAVQVDGNTVTLKTGAKLDLGAAAKGYLADQCRTILSESNASGAVLNLGGTILLYGEKPDGTPFKVGVADPDNPAGYFGYLSCFEGVAATSGGYERYFEQNGTRYIHILDPTAAKPVDNGTLSVTVYSNDGTLADILSTALFVMGADKAATYYQAHDGFEFILLTDDHTLYITEGIYDDFTLADGYALDINKLSK